MMTIKFEVSVISHEAFIVRLYPTSRSSVVKYEPELLIRCREYGVRSPEVIAFSPPGPLCPLGYVIYRMIPGIPLARRAHHLNDRAIRRIAANVVDEVEKLAHVPITGFGELITSRMAEHADWEAFMRDVLYAALDKHSIGAVMAQRLSLARGAIAASLGRFEPVTNPELCWGDISPDNIILDDYDEVNGIIDFESVMAAEPALNDGYLRARFANSTFYKSFASRLAARQRGEPRSALYAVVRALRLAAYASEALPTGLKRDPIEAVLPGLNNAIDELLCWTSRPEVAC
jgi:aminoglycoside phosphotransferase (APT) family kinase protein